MSGWSLSPSISVWRRRRWRLLPGFLLKHLDQLVQVSDDELGAMKAIGSVQANAQQSINDQIGGDAISLHPLGRELQLGIGINHPRLLSPFISTTPPVRINVASESTGSSALIAPTAVPVPSRPPALRHWSGRSHPAPVRAQADDGAAENYDRCRQTAPPSELFGGIGGGYEWTNQIRLVG